ncbi:MAG: hypothetical protein P1V51_02535 [Deltaproteobacteria bacterium]|nr:hypothetical protein [Deltaproteobacteria bacterium]
MLRPAAFLSLAAAAGLMAFMSRGPVPVEPLAPSPSGAAREAPLPEPALAGLAGPFVHENLALYLVRAGPDHPADPVDYLTLSEGLEAGQVAVEETGDVNELKVKNRAGRPLFIQAGEVIRGGRQDRTVGVDLIVPPSPEGIALPSFCVEQGRWSQRGGERSDSFATSTKMVASKGLRGAVNHSKTQGAVWQNVEATKQKLSENLAVQVDDARSASSYELALDHEAIKEVQGAYREELSGLPAKVEDAVGLVWAVNGELVGAEVYGSRKLFLKLWPKLLDVAVIEAVAERDAKAKAPAPTPAQVARFLVVPGGEAEQQTPTSRTRVDYRRTPEHGYYETTDTEVKAWVHRSHTDLDAVATRAPQPARQLQNLLGGSSSGALSNVFDPGQGLQVNNALGLGGLGRGNAP